MSYILKGRTIKKIAVIGSGRIGPDIAFHFSKALHKRGVPVVVVDVEESALKTGSAKVRRKLDKGVEKGKLKPEAADAVFDNLTFTTDYSQIVGADMVIEAATEDLEIKHKTVARAEGLLADDALIASNSSHMEPDAVFSLAKKRARTMVIHSFFPADRNPLVEIVPGGETDAGLVDFVMAFYEQIGKIPIRVKSRFGYAVDPVFEGLFQAAALCVEEGLCDVKQADAIAQKALGLGTGPFASMNMTGGNAIARFGLDEMRGKIMPWFRAPGILNDRIDSGEPWPVAGPGEKVEYSAETDDVVSKRLTGAWFGLVCHVLDSGISNTADLNMAVETGLSMRAPFSGMNKIGVDQSLQLVEEYAAAHEGFEVPHSLKKQAATGEPWEIPVVLRRDAGDVAVVTIRRPRVLNALDADVFTQLKLTFDAIKADDKIKAAVLTGFGVKAFVSGTDIVELAALKSVMEVTGLSMRGQIVFNRIENLGKPVVAAMNGLAFGGGNEAAMACTCRIAAAGQKILAGQPEPNLGIIPGYGGTQRLPRLIGLEKAWPLLRTGLPFSSAQALEWGLIEKEVAREDLVDEAISLARDIARGAKEVRPIPKDPIPVPESLPHVDIGHLSTRIDEIIRKAILEGAAMNLYNGMTHEANLFGECASTEDLKIGMENFLKNGPRKKAQFVNR